MEPASAAAAISTALDVAIYIYGVWKKRKDLRGGVLQTYRDANDALKAAVDEQKPDMRVQVLEHLITLHR
jgi:hypothetical protein